MNKRVLAILCALILPVMLFAQDEGELLDRVVAVVDDEIILESEVMQFVQDIVVRNTAQYRTEAAILELRQQVLDELINQKILLAIALEDTNIIVEDREVDQVLDNRIAQVAEAVGGEEELIDYYGKPLRQIRREFRKQVRDGLFVDRLRQQRLASVNASRQEVEEFYTSHRDELPELPQRVKLAHILIEIKPDEEAVKTAHALADSIYNLLLVGEEFESLAMNYSDDAGSAEKGGLLGTTERGDFVPEFETVAYNLEEGEISSPVESRFGLHIIRLNWRRGEKINTSHILFNLKPTANDEKIALNTIQELRDKLKEGADFTELAKEYSADEESAPNGGDLGWFDTPDMPSEFRIVARDLTVGEVSEPFKTRFGIHLLKLVDRQESRAMTLKDDWERISMLATEQKKAEYYEELIESMRGDVYIEIME